MGRTAAAAAILGCALVAARAEADPPPRAATAFHGGLDLRTDLGTHQFRLAAGLARGAWDFSVVLDPLVVADGQHDIDLFAERMFWDDRVGVLFGWRMTTVAIADGLFHQQRSLLGLTAALPDLAGGRIRSRWSLELATLWVKHGAGTDPEWIAGDRGLFDHFGFGMFVRIEYVAGR